MTPRISEVVIGGVRYPRYGYSRCDACDRARVLFYADPQHPGNALCAACLKQRFAPFRAPRSRDDIEKGDDATN